MAGMPQYEIDLYRKKGSKRQMDMINFAYEHYILCDGLWLPDVPLQAPLSEHKLSGSSLTQLVTQMNLSEKTKTESKYQTYDIFGFAEEMQDEIGQSVPTTMKKGN